MKLFYVSGSCSLAPQILLQELGLKYEPVRVDPQNKGDYPKINPKGSVPAIQLDNGEVLTEVAVILQYLYDQKPESGFFPKSGTWERYRAQEWLNFIATDLHKGFSPIFAADRWLPGKPEVAAELRATVTKNYHRPLGVMNDRLTKNAFVLGEQFSACDAYLFTVLSWSKNKNVDLTLFPALMGFFERMQSRPAVRKALEIEA